MEIKSIHKALEFNQDTWLKCYIDFNTQKKESSQNAVHKELLQDT